MTSSPLKGVETSYLGVESRQLIIGFFWFFLGSFLCLFFFFCFCGEFCWCWARVSVGFGKQHFFFCGLIAIESKPKQNKTKHNEQTKQKWRKTISSTLSMMAPP